MKQALFFAIVLSLPCIIFAGKDDVIPDGLVHASSAKSFDLKPADRVGNLHREFFPGEVMPRDGTTKDEQAVASFHLKQRARSGSGASGGSTP